MKYIDPVTKQEIEVVEHIMTSNYWEYFIIEKQENGQAFALVNGAHNEMGYVCLKELAPHIMSIETDLTDLMPPIGWEKVK